MREVLAVRESALRVAAAEAAHLRDVAALALWCAAEARAELAGGPRVSGQPDDSQVVDTAVVAEVAVALGTSEFAAAAKVDLAMRLTRVLPETLAALEAGRLDLGRARALVEGTRLLDRAAARDVQAEMLQLLGDQPHPGAADPSTGARGQHQANGRGQR